jgi:hypothetical protein
MTRSNDLAPDLIPILRNRIIANGSNFDPYTPSAFTNEDLDLALADHDIDRIQSQSWVRNTYRRAKSGEIADLGVFLESKLKGAEENEVCVCKCLFVY